MGLVQGVLTKCKHVVAALAQVIESPSDQVWICHDLHEHDKVGTARREKKKGQPNLQYSDQQLTGDKYYKGDGDGLERVFTWYVTPGGSSGDAALDCAVVDQFNCGVVTGNVHHGLSSQQQL